MRSRSIRTRGIRKKSQMIDLDITSLLDILVILLVFLLKSYNSSGIILNVPKGIELPTSASSSVNTSGVMVQVSPNIIWVDDKKVLDITENKRRVYDHGGRRIIPLYDELVKKREEVQNIAKSAPGAKKFQGVVNLIVDKTIKYSYIKKLMYTTAEAGYRKYKFVVMGDQ